MSNNLSLTLEDYVKIWYNSQVMKKGYLHITTKVKSRGGQYLKEPLMIKFRL